MYCCILFCVNKNDTKGLFVRDNIKITLNLACNIYNFIKDHIEITHKKVTDHLSYPLKKVTSQASTSQMSAGQMSTGQTSAGQIPGFPRYITEIHIEMDSNDLVKQG